MFLEPQITAATRGLDHRPVTLGIEKGRLGLAVLLSQAAGAVFLAGFIGLV
jgi:hypothetical protein